ncbi:MAG: hypothetical protein HY084_04070 [Gemmatimonadetes bacterium]|nr:hypothetical protein [Gemmatimonadota bacterium]
MNDVRARFLKSILEQLPAERIVELHFFTPIRQGQIETGVAVIAAEPEKPLPVAPEGDDADALVAADDPTVEAALDDETGRVLDEESPYAAEPAAAAELPAAALEPYEPEPAAPRYEVITAVYRWTRKGPERGKWEADVTTEADAPLPTVGTVVKGVHDRAGEELEPLRLTNAELRALLSEPTWQTTP